MKRRNADYKLLKIFEKFESVGLELSNGTFGNIQNVIQGEPVFENGMSYPNTKLKSRVPFYEAVPAPMLLARFVAAGVQVHVIGQNGYKVTWEIVLRHRETGSIATFYDYKGGSSFGACEKGHQDKKFQKDLVTLLNALINPRFPHPYDGCVVGEIA